MDNIPMGADGERFTREEIERVWRRVMPGGDSSEVVDLLSQDGCSSVSPDGGPPEHGFYPPPADIPRESDAREFQRMEDTKVYPVHSNIPYCAPEVRHTVPQGWEPMRVREEMRLLVSEELERSAYYCALRKVACGRQARRDLDRLSHACYKNAKTLSTSLYILSGELWFPVECEPYCPMSEYLDSLRESFRAERYLVDRYDALAASAGDTAVAETAEDLASAHRAAALTLRDLIENQVR